MKKTSLLLCAIFLMSLCGCSEPVQKLTEENQQLKEVTAKEEVKEGKNVDIDYMDSENVWMVQGDIVWLPYEIEERDVMETTNPYAENLNGGDYAKYVVVWLALTNVWNESVTWMTSDVMKITDSKGRKYKPSIEATKSIYIEDAISFTEIKPSIPIMGHVVYEVAKDSEGFYYETDDGTYRIMLENQN